MINEILPNGYNSWTAYYRSKEKKEKRNYWLQGILGMVVFFGAIVLDGVTTLYL